jgi:multidrug efflux pump
MNALRGLLPRSLESCSAAAPPASASACSRSSSPLCAFGLFKALPSELVPNEDRGRVDIRMQGPEGAGYDYMLKVAAQVEPKLQALTGERPDQPAERYLISMPGFGGGSFNSANGVLTLKPMSERGISADDLAAQLNRELSSITGARVIASVRGPFQRGGGGGGGGANVDLIVTGASEYEELARWIEPIVPLPATTPAYVRPRLDYEPNAPALAGQLVREKAAALGVSSTEIGPRASRPRFGSRRARHKSAGGQESDVPVRRARAGASVEGSRHPLRCAGGGGGAPRPAFGGRDVRSAGDTLTAVASTGSAQSRLTAVQNEGYTVAQAVEFLRAAGPRSSPQGPVIRWGGQAATCRRPAAPSSSPSVSRCCSCSCARRPVRELDQPVDHHADRAAGRAAAVRPA